VAFSVKVRLATNEGEGSRASGVKTLLKHKYRQQHDFLGDDCNNLAKQVVVSKIVTFTQTDSNDLNLLRIWFKNSSSYCRQKKLNKNLF
jgi:hypothetical protein